VSAIANATKGSSSNPLSGGGSSSNQEAPKFEVRIRVLDKEAFRPGMSVTAEIETRSRTGVLAVPIQSVTTRLPGAAGAKPAEQKESDAAAASSPPGKPPAPVKPSEAVFALEGDRAKLVAVKTGISDSEFFEIAEGLSEGQTIITGSYKAVSKDLEDGKKVTVGGDAGTGAKEAKP
jgi:HlyD family secretion protein